MYRLFNKLFGWQYVYWENTCDSGVCRIRTLPSGEKGYWQYGKYWRNLDSKRNNEVVLTSPTDKE